jgi:hypothetical protein
MRLTDAVAANGPTDPTPEPSKAAKGATAEAAPATHSTEESDPKETDEAETTLPDTNGAPAADKKPAAPKRKSSSGVPEHKGKKLNKKKSMPKLTHIDAQPGEYFLARLKGYPPWPSIIADEDMLQENMLETRPVTTKQADGTYKEAYADGGKKENERTFPIMFLHTNEL